MTPDTKPDTKDIPDTREEIEKIAAAEDAGDVVDQQAAAEKADEA